MSSERADLVVVGAGTVGGWAGYFAQIGGAGRVIVIDKGRAGEGASSRAAGIVRAQGGTPTTVALGRWSIDFYKSQLDRLGTDSGFRELGYMLLALTPEEVEASYARTELGGTDPSASRSARGSARCTRSSARTEPARAR